MLSVSSVRAKKPLTPFLFLMILLLLVACSPEQNVPANAPVSTPSPTAQSTPSPTSKPTPTPTPSPTPSSTTNLTVYFIDVGQGDSILIDLGDIEVLIDGGDRGPGVLNYLSSYVDGALEVMIATHPHADHIGGLIDVLAKYQVMDIWLNGDNTTSATFSQFMNSVNAEGATIHQAERGNIIQAGNLTFIVLNPAKPLLSNTNDNSIVLSLKYGDIDFLFTGDAENKAEAAMLAQSVVPVPDIEILKVGHHGSKTASSPQFLNVVKPDVAIYSCGLGNSYGHPHKETIDNLNSVGAKIYGTNTFGTIEVITDGKTYSVQTTK